MSRVLPDRPDLDHLKKQARRLLNTLRHSDPSLQLADALHTLAREYGFASWPMLKAHVESITITQTPPEPRESADLGGRGGTGTPINPASDEPIQPSFDRYTHKAKQALFFSRYAAGELGSPVIEHEHLLMGLIQAAHGAVSGLFDRTGLSVEQVRAALSDPASEREKLAMSVVIPFSDGSKRVVRHAAVEANQLSHQSIGMVHIVLGILRDEHSIAATMLRDNGLTLDRLRADAPTLLEAEPS